MSLNVYWIQQPQYFISISEGLITDILENIFYVILRVFANILPFPSCGVTEMESLLYETQLLIDYITVGTPNLSIL